LTAGVVVKNKADFAKKGCKSLRQPKAREVVRARNRGSEMQDKCYKGRRKIPAKRDLATRYAHSNPHAQIYAFFFGWREGEGPRHVGAGNESSFFGWKY